MGFPVISPHTPTQQAVQRLTASIQAETTIGIAQRLDEFVSTHAGEHDVIPVEVLSEFYSLIYGEALALRRVASGA